LIETFRSFPVFIQVIPNRVYVIPANLPCHPRESGDLRTRHYCEIPAFAGMTEERGMTEGRGDD
jgi:hypothetical protein